MKCPNCNAELTDDSIFCSECGTPIERAPQPEPIPQPTPIEPVIPAGMKKCDYCSTVIPSDSIFCPSCRRQLYVAPTVEYCRFCGNPLINGKCNCQRSMGADPEVRRFQGFNISLPKMREPFLVPSFNLNMTSFSSFISSFRDQTGISEKSSDNSDPFERDTLIVPDCVKPEDDEVNIKQYNIAKLRTRLKFMKAEGRLQITNKRVLFRATGTSLTGNLVQEHEFNLNEIGGIEIHKDYKFSLLNLFFSIILEAAIITLIVLLKGSLGTTGIVLGIILGIIGIIPSVIVYKRAGFKLFCSAISAASFYLAVSSTDGSKGFLIFLLVLASIVYIIDLIIVCFIPNLLIKIKVKGAESAVLIGSQKSLLARRGGQTGDYSGFAEILPWEDTILAMNEIGALIHDVQTMGDIGIARWTSEG